MDFFYTYIILLSLVYKNVKTDIYLGHASF